MYKVLPESHSLGTHKQGNQDQHIADTPVAHAPTSTPPNTQKDHEDVVGNKLTEIVTVLLIAWLCHGVMSQYNENKSLMDINREQMNAQYC